MSSHIEAHREQYVRLMRRFAEAEIGAAEFSRLFLGLREEDITKDLAMRDAVEHQRLVDGYLRGAISDREFATGQRTAWGFDPEGPWLALFDKIHGDIELWDQGLPNSDVVLQMIDESELRSRIIRHLAIVASLKS